MGSTVDPDWPLPNTPFDNINVDISDRREGIHHSFHRPARFKEEFDSHGYQHDMDIPEGPYFMLGPDTGHRDQHSAYHQGPREYTVFESHGNHLCQNLDDQSYQHQMALDDSLRYQVATAGLAHQADDAISLDSLLVNEEKEREAISCSNSGPGQGPLESSQNVHQDTIHAPSSSAELVHDQSRDLTREESGTLPLHDEFGAYEQSKFMSALVPDVGTGRPDPMNYPGHSTGGLRLASPKSEGMLSKIRDVRYRIIRRFREL